MLEQPQATGELFAMNADGRKTEMLAGFRVDDGGLGTTIKPKKGSDSIAALPIGTAMGDGRNALVEVDAVSAPIPTPALESIDVFTGRRARVAMAPVRQATFSPTTRASFASSTVPTPTTSASSSTAPAKATRWTLLSIEDSKGRFEYPIGFSADNKTVYLHRRAGRRVPMRSSPSTWPAANARWSCVTTTSIRADIIYRNGTRIPVGAFFMDGKPRTAFIDETVAGSAGCTAAWRRPSPAMRRDHLADRRWQAGAGAGLQRPQSGRLLPVRHGRQEGGARAGAPRAGSIPRRWRRCAPSS